MSVRSCLITGRLRARKNCAVIQNGGGDLKKREDWSSKDQPLINYIWRKKNEGVRYGSLLTYERKDNQYEVELLNGSRTDPQEHSEKNFLKKARS